MDKLTPDLDAPHSQPVDKFATVNGMQIHYLDWGAAGKPPFILLHGIARTAYTFTK